MDASSIILLVLLLTVVANLFWRNLLPGLREKWSAPEGDDTAEETPADNADSEPAMPTRPVSNERIAEVLSALGCNPKIDDTGIHFAYQGKNFIMEGNESQYARRIVLPWIIGREATDVIDIRDLLDAANRAMVESWGGKFVTHMADIEGTRTFGMSLMLDQFLIAEDEHLDSLLRALLDSFFETITRFIVLYNENSGKSNLFSDVNYMPDDNNSFMTNNLN